MSKQEEWVHGWKKYYEDGIRADVVRAGLDPRGMVGLAHVHLLVEEIERLREKKNA